MKRVFNLIYSLWIKRSSDAYISFLRKKGCKIGNGTLILNPRNILIDITRPSLIEIGENVFLHQGLKLLTHDYASWVFVNLYNDFLPSSGKIKLGNNIWFGEDVTVLKGVTIGDNCIIGLGSIVTKDIPPNSIAVGVPAKVVGSIDNYYKKRKIEYVDEAINYAISIKKNLQRSPVIEDFYDDYPCFVDIRNIDNYMNFPFHRVLKGLRFENWKKAHKADFNGFDEFMNVVNEKIKNDGSTKS